MTSAATDPRAANLDPLEMQRRELPPDVAYVIMPLSATEAVLDLLADVEIDAVSASPWLEEAFAHAAAARDRFCRNPSPEEQVVLDMHEALVLADAADLLGSRLGSDPEIDADLRPLRDFREEYVALKSKQH